MLQTIREHTQGWIAAVIISLIILSFALWGIHSYFVGGGNTNEVATVNGVEISKQQLTLAYERVRRQIQMQFGTSNPLTTKDETVLKRRALQALIEIEVLKQASLYQGFSISELQVESYLQSMPDFKVNGEFSVDRFQEVMSSSLLSTGEFLDLMRSSLLIEQPKLGIVLSSFALPDEINYTIAIVNQERDLDYLNLPLQYFLSQPIMISTTQIENYYNEHKNEFMTPEQVSVDYIELSLNELSSRVSATDSQLKNFYNDNKNSFIQPMTWKLVNFVIPVPQNAPQADLKKAEAKAKTAVDVLKKGAEFDKIASEYPTTAFANQSVFALNQVPAELQKAVAQLKEAKQISEPIKTSQGFVILKAVEVNEPYLPSFDVAKDKVKAAYVRQHVEEIYAELRDQLADLTYEHPDSLASAAEKLGLSIKTSELFSKDKPGKDISQYKKVRNTAFSNDVLNLRNNSDVIPLNSENVIVLRLKSHIASALLPLSTVNQQIENKLKVQEAKTRAEKFTKELVEKLKAGTNPQQLATDYKLSWNKTGFLGRYSTKVDSAILDVAFRLPRPDSTKINYGMTRLQNGYAIIALKSVKDGNIKDKKQYDVFAEQVQNSDGLLEYELYKQSQINNAKIKFST